MKKIVIFLVIFFIARPVFADSPKFSVATQTIYKISPDGNTMVTKTFTLTNLTADFFPQVYSFKLNDNQINNLSVKNAIFTRQGQDINVKFDNEVVGLGKILRWNLSYETPSIAKRIGRLWQINLPKNPDLPGQTENIVSLIIPTTFGKKVAQNIEIYDPNNDKVPYQALNFKITYSLYNSRLYPITTSLPLPRDTNYQKIFLNSLSPQPKNIHLDHDNNWIALYDLGPVAKLNVVATGSAALFINPQIKITSEPNPENYLGPDKFWQTDDPIIQKTAQSIKTPEAINKYVESTLEMTKNPKKYHRLGARGAILQPKNATNLEYSDLFITLARAAKIPSRQIYGFAGSSLQIWPQYYDNLKMDWSPNDLDRLVLKISGENNLPSMSNISAQIETVQKDLNIEEIPKVTANIILPAKITSGFQTEGKVFVENQGPTIFFPETISLDSKVLELQNKIYLTNPIAPFGNQLLNIKILPSSPVLSVNDIITLKFGTQTKNYSVKLEPIYKNPYIVLFIILICFGIISIITQVTRSLSLQKH